MRHLEIYCQLCKGVTQYLEDHHLTRGEKRALNDMNSRPYCEKAIPYRCNNCKTLTPIWPSKVEKLIVEEARYTKKEFERFCSDSSIEDNFGLWDFIKSGKVNLEFNAPILTVKMKLEDLSK